MTLGDHPSVPSATAPTAPAGRPADDAARARVAELAREFEAVLLAQMLRQMRQSLLVEEDQEGGLGGQTLTDTTDVELGRALAAQGGIGLAAIIEQGLGRSAVGSDGSQNTTGFGGAGLPSGIVGPSTRPVAPVVLPPASRGLAEPDVPGASGLGWRQEGAASDDGRLTSPLDTAVTSKFGWRADPFHGVRRFHAGVDFRAAYGREVPTAAPGRVVFAGEQGGYGHTVVVEHSGGVETRYAHLSAVLVTTGQELATGEIVGRVGQSGRATGPHLHFEVRLDGRPVDPSRLAGVLPSALKEESPDVDFSFDRVSRQPTGDRSEP